MQSTTDDERKAVLGEVLADELKAILEYVKDVPFIKQELRRMNDKLESMDSRLTVVERVVVDHEADISFLKSRIA